MRKRSPARRGTVAVVVAALLGAGAVGASAAPADTAPADTGHLGYGSSPGDPAPEENFQATVKLIETAHNEIGGVHTLASHMDNFVTGGSFYDTSGDVVTRILPGGDHNVQPGFGPRERVRAQGSGRGAPAVHAHRVADGRRARPRPPPPPTA
jgi:hypothetical protein